MAGDTVSHYRVLEPIGGGGMGVVHRAVDERLGRTVALKFLSPELVRDPAARRRFLTEARAISALDHPNICTLFEIDETADGRLFLAMAHYDGETLRARIERGPLPPAEAIRIARGIARGLAHAHRAGIVHRDIKPGNVMLTAAGEVKILDFGLAKLASNTQALTRPGVALGTLAYMAPEHARGDAVNERSDLWALGVVLYEMLNGKPPFRAGSERALLALILEEEPRTLPGGLAPAALESLIADLLAKDPARRPSSAEQVATRLEALLHAATTAPPAPSPPAPGAPVAPRNHRRAIAVAVVLLLAAAALSAYLLRRAPVAPPRSLAVLPFANLTGDKALDYLGEGISAVLIQQLSAIPGLNVVSRADSRPLGQSGRSAHDVAHQLGVAGVVEGQLLRAEDRLRIVASLTAAGSGFVIWSQSLEGRPEEVFHLQEALVRELATALRTRSADPEKARLASTSGAAHSGPAYDLYLRALQLLDQVDNPSRNTLAASLLREALDLDPSFALARATLSEALVEEYAVDRDPAQIALAEREARQALADAPGTPSATIALASVLRRSGHIAEASESLRRLVARLPDNDEADLELALCAEDSGDAAEAERWLREAIRVRPEYWLHWNELGSHLLRHGDLAAAGEAFQRAADLAPEVSWPRQNLGTLALMRGDYTAAVRAYESLPQPIQDAELASNLGTAHFYTGRLEEAERDYRLAVRLQPKQASFYGNLGDVLARRGDSAAARAAYAEGARLLGEEIAVNPDRSSSRINRALFLAKAGDCGDAAAVIAGLGLEQRSAFETYGLARTYAVCDRRAEALSAIERALALGYPREGLDRDSEFSRLRGDPTFVRLAAPAPPGATH